MSHQARREYLKAVRERYHMSSRTRKGLILDEFCLVFGCTRKYAIRLLGRGLHDIEPRRGRPCVYPRVALLPLVYELWLAMGRINSKRMKEALPEWLHYWQDFRLTPEIREWLLRLSASTIERLLSYSRSRVKGLSATKRAKRFMMQIPLQPKDWNVTKPGTVQADTVAHTHTTLEGDFANTLTVTDIHTGWTENRAMWTKSATRTRDALRDVEQTLPFKLETFKSDNGTEFMNNLVYRYFVGRSEPVNVVRSRPYKKNDNCYVEQKNFTHVRELFGYIKIERPEQVQWMNRIYKELWNPLTNFFLPSTKLLTKLRIGAKIQKKFDRPRTPYDRVLETQDLPEHFRQYLTEWKQRLNPFDLSERLERELKLFEKENRSYLSKAA